MSQAIIFSSCPRCGERAFEVLKSYAHCVQCNYFSDEDNEATPVIPKWAKEAVEKSEIHIEESKHTQRVA